VSKTNFLWCWIFYLYGKGEPKKKLVSYVLSRISKNRPANLSKGSQIKDFINVEDASNQIIKVINNDDYDGALNICSGKGLSVKNFITGIAKKIKKEKYLFFNNKNSNYIKGKITIGLNTIIGSGSIVLPKVNISKKVSIGALSLVNKNINLPGVYSNIPVKKNK